MGGSEVSLSLAGMDQALCTPLWIDSHCHLDAPEFDADRRAVRERARALGVGLCLIPAVAAPHFERVLQWATQCGDGYALGIHPLYVHEADDEDLDRLDAVLSAQRGDPHLVAVGEIGLDAFVPHWRDPAQRERQQYFFSAQLALARKYGLPVVLHVRRAIDEVLAALRKTPVSAGIAHAFNGSAQQAAHLAALNMALGFGGGCTHARALHLQALVQKLPLNALVLETDAPDIPPAWLYVDAQARQAGRAQGRNEPGELPRIASAIAALRSLPLQELAEATRANTLRVLPGLSPLWARLCKTSVPVVAAP